MSWVTGNYIIVNFGQSFIRNVADEGLCPRIHVNIT